MTTDPIGTELGLAIVDAVVSARGQEIVATETIDGGGRFESQLEPANV